MVLDEQLADRMRVFHAGVTAPGRDGSLAERESEVA
jgi:hypothetical protein